MSSVIDSGNCSEYLSLADSSDEGSIAIFLRSFLLSENAFRLIV